MNFFSKMTVPSTLTHSTQFVQKKMHTYTHTNMVLAFPDEFIQVIANQPSLCAVSSDKVRGGNFHLVQLLKKPINLSAACACTLQWHV